MPQPSVIRAALPSPVIRMGGRASTRIGPVDPDLVVDEPGFA